MQPVIHCKYDQLVDPKSLKPFDRNRNKHPPEEIEHLGLLIEGHGMRSPVTIAKAPWNCIAKGHGTTQAFIKKGWDKIPVVYQEFADYDSLYAYVQSDNAIQQTYAQLDLAGINTDLPELGPFDIKLLGIKDFALEPADKYGDKDADATPELRPTSICRGDLFQLGNHRLLCGDSCVAGDVEKLMNGETADMWLTDPPYGVSYQSNGRPGKHQKIENDSMSLDEMKVFWCAAATSAINACSDEAAYYWFACQGGDQMMMMMSLSEAGWKVRHELIWNKDSMVMGRCDYHYKHEPILYGWKTKGKHNWYSDRTQVSVLDFPRPKKSDEHPTMKPVALIQYLIGNNTRPSQLVLDTFIGSGTTLIAAEKANRRCFGVEISTEYTDVAIRRWELLTGQKAVKLN